MGRDCDQLPQPRVEADRIGGALTGTRDCDARALVTGCCSPHHVGGALIGTEGLRRDGVGRILPDHRGQRSEEPDRHGGIATLVMTRKPTGWMGSRSEEP